MTTKPLIIVTISVVAIISSCLRAFVGFFLAQEKNGDPFFFHCTCERFHVRHNEAAAVPLAAGRRVTGGDKRGVRGGEAKGGEKSRQKDVMREQGRDWNRNRKE